MKILKEYTILVLIVVIFLVTVILNSQINKLELKLTAEEKKYIQNNPVLLLGPDPDFAPVEFYENGEFKGILPDLVQYINENTGLTIKMIKYETWDDVIKGIKNNELEILGAVSKSKNRETYLSFTESFMSIPNVLVTQKDTMIVIDDEFSNLSIAVVRNSAKHDLLLENYPESNIFPVKNIQTGLKSLTLGNVDAFFGSMTQISYYIDQYKFSNLKINRELDQSFEYSYPLHFAVQKDNLILQSILNKTLINMPKEKKTNIINRWMQLNTNDYFVSKDIVFRGLLVFFLVVLVFISIIHLLRYELERRTVKISDLNKKLLGELSRRKKMTHDISLSLISVIEIYDNYTKGHSKNVANYSLTIAKGIDFNESELEECYYSALLHDLGKTIIPNKIVCKEGKLSRDEYEVIKKHSYYSYRILKNIEAFDLIAENVLYHHERYDGKGYPKGIEGNKIPIISRIICIADAFDAMTTDRTYRSKLSKIEAIEELEKCAGSQFDPELVDIFVEALARDQICDITDMETSIG